MTAVRSTTDDGSVPERWGVRLYCSPRVGRPLVVIREAGNRRIVTSPVVRVLERGGATYVQTRNTTYCFDGREDPPTLTCC